MGLFGRTKSKENKEKGQHTDPVCGMVVVEAQAVGPDTVQGEAYWFCSVECQDQFKEREGPRSRRDQARSRRERKREERLVR